MTRRPDPEEEHGGVDGCEQGAVQPTTTLRDELRDLKLRHSVKEVLFDTYGTHSGGDISGRFRALDIAQTV